MRWALEVAAGSVSNVDGAKASPSASSSLPSTTARMNDGLRFAQLTSQANDDLEFTPALQASRSRTTADHTTLIAMG